MQSFRCELLAAGEKERRIFLVLMVTFSRVLLHCPPFRSWCVQDLKLLPRLDELGPAAGADGRGNFGGSWPVS
jgi:hypothetical protein